MRYHFIIILYFLLKCNFTAAAQKQIREDDKEQLGIALDYFSAGKYHEALPFLMKLDKKYKLNPRFKAYIGVCLYYEWNYEETVKYIDPYLTSLEVFAPQERSVYYFVSAESHFYMGEYMKAMPLYEKFLKICHDNEKPDALFRLSYCLMEAQKWEEASECLIQAQTLYTTYGTPTDKKARLIQIEKMINGCQTKYLKTNREWINKFLHLSGENQN